MAGKPPQIVVPPGRSAAERRLAAVAALHQPVISHIAFGPTCGECHTSWPCATAKLLGPWPGEPTEQAL